MQDLLIVATSALKPEQAARLPDAPYPRVDYLLLADALGADILNYGLYNRLPFKRALRRLETMARSDIALATAALTRARRYETIVAMSERVGIPLALCKRAGLLRARLVFRFTAWSQRQARLFGRIDALSHVDHIVVESRPLGALLQRRYAVPPERISFVPYAIDDQFFAPERAGMRHSGSQPLVFTAGETRGRDYETLVDALAPLNGIDVEIASYGSWFAREQDVDTVTALPPHIRVAGRKSRSEMRAAYARAACVVVPLHNQVFSAGITVSLEALAMEKPLVVTRSDGLDGYLEDGVTCLMTPPGDADALRRAVTYLLDRPQEARRLARAGRAVVSRRFGLARYVEQMAGVLHAMEGTRHM